MAGNSWLLLVCLVPAIFAQSNSTYSLPRQLTYLLPRPFNNTFTEPFVKSYTTNETVRQILDSAHGASFISYDQEFDNIVGSAAEINVVASSSVPFAFEGGIWVADSAQAWFTGLITADNPSFISILDLKTFEVFQPNLTGPAANFVVNPNGGYYINGTVYIGTFGNATITPGLFAIDVKTYETTEIINSYFGVPISGADDITVAVSRVTGESCLFYSDFLLANEGAIPTWPGPQQLPYSVWRYTRANSNLQAVISPLQVGVPNGLAVDRFNSILIVTDNPKSVVFGTSINETSGSAGIYQFDLGGPDGCTPMNRQLLGFARQGFANGVKIDDLGRIWTAEYEGIVVRSQQGRILGVFNSAVIVENSDVQDIAPQANFVLAGDQLILLAFDKVLAVTLGQQVKTWY